jgi:glycosyltransferase involved in cell wall biosynthesis
MTEEMLDLIIDNRSGVKLEIVFYTLNEEKRIDNFFRYYGSDFDIVLMDGGSTDATIDMAIRAGATVFRRVGDETPGHGHFAFYVNHITKSGYSFCLLADEFVQREKLLNAFKRMQQRQCVIFGRRIDWLYGRRVNKPPTITPLGLCKGDAIYNPAFVHASMEYIERAQERIFLDVHHLHIWTMKRYFGQAGAYAYAEVELFLKSDKPVWRFVRRFVISEVLMLPRKIWQLRNEGLAYSLWMILISLTIPLIALLSLIEQRILMSPEKQREQYEKFYGDS